jgi:hypothetical protein
VEVHTALIARGIARREYANEEAATRFTNELKDLIEHNEAFAVQVLRCIQELEIDKEKLNINGGTIAPGYLLSCSSTRSMTTLLYELEQRTRRCSLASMCIGVGQSIATVSERLNQGFASPYAHLFQILLVRGKFFMGEIIFPPHFSILFSLNWDFSIEEAHDPERRGQNNGNTRYAGASGPTERPSTCWSSVSRIWLAPARMPCLEIGNSPKMPHKRRSLRHT